MTIAEQLNGKIVDPKTDPPYEVDSQGMPVFEDGSNAFHIVSFEKCEPFQAASCTTMSYKKVYYWKAVR